MKDSELHFGAGVALGAASAIYLLVNFLRAMHSLQYFR